MNYYEHHLGDYMRDTAHLSMLEDGAYRRLLDAYYIKEAPIPTELRDACRLVRAQSKQERDAVEIVLKEFFTLGSDGWHHRRCEFEIARYRDKQAKAKKSADARWNAHRSESDGDANAYADAMQTHSEGNALQSPVTSNQTPDTSNQKPKKKGAEAPTSPGKLATIPACPHLRLIDLFGEKLPTLAQPKPELWDGTDAGNLRARWKWVLTAKRRNGERYATNEAEAIAWFARYFAFVAESDFLMGRNKDFACTLQWLIKKDNFSKVVQGNYENKP